MKQYLLLIFFFTPLLIWFQWVDGFPDPDSFYHLKMSQLIFEQGIVTQFPWLPLTTLGTHYADHQLLYHIIVSVFLFVFEGVVAAKVVTVLCTVLALCVFYWVMKKNELPFPLFFTFLLGITPDFIFRASLVKTVSFSFLFLMLCFYFIQKKKFVLLLVLSFLYVWLYAGFVMALIVFCAYVAGTFLSFRVSGERVDGKSLVLLGMSICVGLLLGVMVNPYFPSNLFFYYEQIVRIALVNQIHNEVNVGMEWYPYDPFLFFTQNIFVQGFFFVGLILFFLHISRMHKYVWTWFFLSFFFLFFTLKSQRNIEYFIPSAVMFSSFVFQVVIKKAWVLSWYRQIKEALIPVRITLLSVWYKVVFLCVVMMICVTVMRGLSHTKTLLSDTNSVHRFEKASLFLKEKKAVKVFHTSWDEFPMLFYHNDVSTYVAGLDPTFLYDADPVLYRKWMDLVLGTQNVRVYDTMKQEFGASYVLISKEHPALQSTLQEDERFVLVYEDSDVWIYFVS